MKSIETRLIPNTARTEINRNVSTFPTVVTRPDGRKTRRHFHNPPAGGSDRCPAVDPLMEININNRFPPRARWFHIARFIYDYFRRVVDDHYRGQPYTSIVRREPHYRHIAKVNAGIAFHRNHRSAAIRAVTNDYYDNEKKRTRLFDGKLFINRTMRIVGFPIGRAVLRVASRSPVNTVWSFSLRRTTIVSRAVPSKMTERGWFDEYCEKTTMYGMRYFVMKRRPHVEKSVGSLNEIHRE